MEKKQKKAAIYIRVSTEAQAEEGYSIDAQKERLSAYCVSKGIRNYEFYIDGGYSGSNLNRPEITRLIEDAKAGKIQCVLVYKLDRLSRSQRDTLYLIEDVFNPHNVDFVSMNESMDTATPMGRLMLGILSAFAQLERENIRERTRMGMKERVKSGLWMGGGRIPYGYDYDPQKGILVPNEDAEKVRMMYRLYQQGYSADRIARMLDLKYDRLVMQILQRKSNAGFICYNGEEYMGKHEPIISLEEYEKTMELIQERTLRKTNSTEHLLTGLVYCGKCGAKMRYQKWSKAGHKLVCYSQQKTKPYLIKDENCDNIRPWADEVEDIVVKDLFRFALDYKDESKEAQMALSPLELLQQQYNGVSQKLKRLYTLYAEGTDDMLIETIGEQKKKLEQIAKQIKSEEERNLLTAKVLEKKKSIEHISDVWDGMTLQEKKKIIRSVVEKVVVTGDKVEVHYQLM